MELETESLKSTMKSGTGEMPSMTDVVRDLQGKGYRENLVPRFDHFSCQSEKFQLYPNDLKLDQVVRFENTSDPDDQSILYAISSKSRPLKGIYIESYGLYHENLSKTIIDWMWARSYC